jgi:GT2 family glycosyltransferase
MTTLDIVIVNWNSGPYLSRALASIQEAEPPQARVNTIVVDNCSSDESLELANQCGLKATIVVNTVNRGFAAACNQGASMGTGEYVLFMNPDLELNSESLSTPLDFMRRDADQHIAICGIRLVDAHGRLTASCARFPTAATLIARCFALDRILPAHFPPHFLTEAELRASRPVDQVIGAFFLVRRKAFEALDRFDERFFMYYEELDLSYRAARGGYSSYYLSEAHATHYGGRSTTAVPARSLVYSWDSRIKYAFKHFSTFEGYCVLGATLLAEPWTRLIYALASRSARKALVTVAAAAMTWSRVGTLIAHGTRRHSRAR